jgi:hypothetical protein
MWNVADETLSARELKSPQQPLWRIPPFSTLSTIAAGAEGESYALPGGVFPSFFSIEAIEGFLTGFADESWFEYVEEVVWSRRAGADLFSLRFVRGGQEFTILIQHDKYERHELNTALGHILERLQKEGGNHLIDATYEGKIVVRSLPSGAGEGGSK